MGSERVATYTQEGRGMTNVASGFLVSAILEIARGANGPRRASPYLLEIVGARVGGAVVLGAVGPDADSTTVPCFGHDHRCPCEAPEPWHVERHFGVVLFMDRPVTAEMFGDYYLSSHARLTLCGLTLYDEATTRTIQRYAAPSNLGRAQ